MRRWTSVLVHVESSASLASSATVFLLTAMVGCDSTPPPAPTPTLESIKDCGAGWQPFTTAQPSDGYSPLVYQAGTLYYTSVNAKALLALPTNGGPPATLAPLVTNELWLEGITCSSPRETRPTKFTACHSPAGRLNWCSMAARDGQPGARPGAHLHGHRLLLDRD